MTIQKLFYNNILMEGKASPFAMAWENVAFMHECCPQSFHKWRTIINKLKTEFNKAEKISKVVQQACNN